MTVEIISIGREETIFKVDDREIVIPTEVEWGDGKKEPGIRKIIYYVCLAENKISRKPVTEESLRKSIADYLFSIMPEKSVTQYEIITEQ